MLREQISGRRSSAGCLHRQRSEAQCRRLDTILSRHRIAATNQNTDQRKQMNGTRHVRRDPPAARQRCKCFTSPPPPKNQRCKAATGCGRRPARRMNPSRSRTTHTHNLTTQLDWQRCGSQSARWHASRVTVDSVAHCRKLEHVHGRSSWQSIIDVKAGGQRDPIGRQVGPSSPVGRRLSSGLLPDPVARCSFSSFFIAQLGP
jgi:hypothetical protein